ncbi:hypothetical protein KSP39_PZI000905 [Platanthera zijinensis]|uniref:Uncharacterized protein n=1 Tax=Platanthera zijinensis TaxID=2320716 RepID=A0AAP0GG30_9ASPA
MPRPQLFNSAIDLTAPKAGISLASLLLFFTLAALLCASHGRQRGWHRRTKLVISPHHVQPGAPHCAGEVDEEDNSYEDDGECVWKKRIMMGGKCHFPDFSGAIVYDSNGNVVVGAGIPTLIRPL